MSSIDESITAGISVGGWGRTPHWGVYASVFLASMALLTLEVSLTRFFSFTVWYHLAYLTISVAILGFGASGAFVAAFPGVFRRDGQTLIIACLVLAALATVGMLSLLSRVTLDLHTVTAELRHGAFPTKFSLKLLLYYVTVAAPFTVAGFAVGLPFAAYPRRMGRLYFYDLFGAALGCLMVVLLIEAVGVPGLIIGAAGVLLAAAATLSAGAGKKRVAALLGVVSMMTVLGSGSFGDMLDIRITSSKGLSRAAELGFIGSVNEADYTKWTPLNRVDAYGWEKPTGFVYWYANGMMKGFEGPRPRVGSLYHDGSNGSNIYPYGGPDGTYGFLKHHLLRTPYIIKQEPRVLVVGVGGGIDMINAIEQGAEHVTGVELQPKVVELLTGPVREFTGGFYFRDDVTLVAGEGRHFVRKSSDQFDLIQITAVDTFAAQASGAYILAESYLYTVEGVRDFIDHLNEDGVLSMVVGELGDPPALAVRLGLDGYRALQSMGRSDPSEHLLVVASRRAPRGIGPGPATQLVMVKKNPFEANEVKAVREFSENKGFQVLYAPDPKASEAYPLAEYLGPDETIRQAALEKSPLRMDAVYDDNPFFYNVARWSNFGPTADAHTFQMPGSFVGQLVLVLMLLQSAVLGTILIAGPLVLGAREGVRARGVVGYMWYFLALGIGFMFIEISLIQSFILFLGSPTYSLSITIFALLLFASLGSLWSSRFVDAPEWALKRLVVALVILIALYGVALAPLLRFLLPLPFGMRALIAMALQVPLGLTLGMFMPLGIALVSDDHARLVPWAWGINGIGSVFGTTLAVIVAMTYGFRTVGALAACLYVAGTMQMLWTRRSVRSERA